LRERGLTSSGGKANVGRRYGAPPDLVVAYEWELRSWPWGSQAELVLDGGAGKTLRRLAAALGMVEGERPRRSDG
jgi:hypothetical protein